MKKKTDMLFKLHKKNDCKITLLKISSFSGDFAPEKQMSKLLLNVY